MLTAWTERAPPRAHFVMASYGVMEPLRLFKTCKHGCCVNDGICGPMVLPRYWRDATPAEIAAWPAGVRASAVPLTEAQRDGLTVKRDVSIGGVAALKLCASTRDGEPAKTGRHCPLDLSGDDDE